MIFSQFQRLKVQNPVVGSYHPRDPGSNLSLLPLGFLMVDALFGTLWLAAVPPQPMPLHPAYCSLYVDVCPHFHHFEDPCYT